MEDYKWNMAKNVIIVEDVWKTKIWAMKSRSKDVKITGLAAAVSET